MKESDRTLKRRIYGDCRNVMILSTIVYTLADGATALLSVYTAGVLGQFADAVFQFNLSFGLANIGKLLLCIGISVLFIPVLNTVADVLMLFNALRHDRLVLDRFFDKTYAKAMKIEAGEAQYRLDNDPNDFRCSWTEIVDKFIATPITFVYLLYSALPISRIFTLIVFAVSLLKLTVPVAVRNLAAKYDRQTRKYNTRVRAYETEITGKPYVVKMYGLKDAFINRLDKLYRKYFKNVQVKSIRCQSVSDNILKFLDTFCVLIILLAGAVMVAKKALTPGAVAAMVGYFSVFNLIIGNVSFIVRNIPILKNIADRMTVLYADPEDLSGEDAGPVRDITASGLHFAYGEKQIFDHLDFHICTGAKTAVCGKNGSGKSTLIKILCGLLKGYKGSLKVNGKEFNRISPESWRRQIAYAEQEPYLFAGSVKENIRLGNLSASDEEIEKTMDELGILYLSQREISMSQNDLSGGEKQKISIARALMKNTPILILDEPSNNLDQDTLHWLKDFIAGTEKTIVYISHDPSITAAADNTVFMADYARGPGSSSAADHSAACR